MGNWWSPQRPFLWRSIICTAPAPYRFASNIDEQTTVECTCSLFVCRYSLVFLNQWRFSHPTMSFKLVFQSSKKQSYKLQRISQNYFCFLLSQKPRVSLNTILQRAVARKPRCQPWGNSSPRAVRSDPRLSKGRCWTQGCSSDSYYQLVRTESSQGRPK